MIKIILLVVGLYFYLRFVLMRPAIDDRNDSQQQSYKQQQPNYSRAEPEAEPLDEEYLDYEELD